MSRIVMIAILLVFACGCASVPEERKTSDPAEGKCPGCGKPGGNEHSDYPEFSDIVFPDMT
ncbi:hypothetical protein ACFLQ8_00490 [Candidatus Auribacterota bacterium]